MRYELKKYVVDVNLFRFNRLLDFYVQQDGIDKRIGRKFSLSN